MLSATVTVIPDVTNARGAGDDVPETVEHPETGELVATIGWHSTDAWRGYYEATPVAGWVKVGEGCNCGSWDDTPPGTSNEECEAQINELAEKYGDIVVVLGSSSNVFSLPFDVLAREEDAMNQREVFDALNAQQTYKVVRFYQGDHEAEEIRTGLTLEEAQAWCGDPETSSSTCTSEEGLARTAEHGSWFDGYERENSL